MAKIYANLIKNQVINPATGNAYTILDVPDITFMGKNLREEVLKLLEEGD